ncbi:MAG: hypothetical protein KIT02_01735 [Devosia sp.]|uniref:GumC family protein n=1 Tax=Devosia sp. TaxID=1871048 RepID=UPI0024C6D3D6|nr:Wzz/FepE/Etk N-terminal domain-containing protein [Devosia sp.]UYN99987.1 MAG: hypothetical protein KIT02_01735 [Devosia sp.]
MANESMGNGDARIDVRAVLTAIVRRLPRIIAVTLLLLAATFVFLMFQPRLYESSASILVEPRSNPYARASGEQAPSLTGGEAGVVSSQIELLKSRDTLLTVIDQLDLRSEAEFNGSGASLSPLGLVFQLMGRTGAPVSVDETVLATLYDRLTVVQERDSRIISVLVRSTSPQLAAEIANAVANAHVNRRASLSIADTADASGWLRSEIDRLRVSVQEAESAVAEFKVNNDLFTGQNNTSLLDQQLSTISSQITAAQERKNTAMSRATLIRELIQRGQPIEAIADVRNSAVIQQLSQEKARLQGERAQRSATLLSNHPTIRALNAQIGELDTQIRLEAQRVADGFEAEAEIEADLATSLEAELARAKTSASTATRDTVALDGLEREAKAQRDLLEAYLARYNEASSRVEANSALPDVRVVSMAAPAVSPASPKSSLILLAVGLVAVLGQVGAVIFSELMSGRAVVEIQRRPAGDAGFAPEFVAEAEPVETAAIIEAEPAAAVVVTAEPALSSAATTEPLPAAEKPGRARSLFRSLGAILPKRSAPPVDTDAEQSVAPAVEPARPEAPAQSNQAAAAFIRTLTTPQASDDGRSRDHSGGEPQPSRSAPLMADPTPQADQEWAAASDWHDEAEPPTPPATAASRRATTLAYGELIGDLVMGRNHLLLLADNGASQPAAHLAEDIAADALAKGLSVALIDAGTGRQSDEPGISDLSLGLAGFGDVVQKSADNTFAEVNWGGGARIDTTSSRPTTLVEALGDIYEVVLVLTGPLSRASTLPLFADLDGRVVLVGADEQDADALEEAREQLQRAGLGRVDIATVNAAVAA